MNATNRILVVEDSSTQAIKMTALLERLGWEALCATTAEEALDEINRRLPDLIVVDYYLPGMNGAELCQQVRMNVNTRGIPLLMLATDETHEAELRGLESGADDYVAKSVEDEILVLRIQTLLRKSYVQSTIIAPNESYFRKAHILVVDDSPTYLEFLVGELQQDGFTVTPVTDGKTALDKVANTPFDCVIVDLVMPEIDGIEVCRQLTVIRRTMDNPIVVLMLTAHETREDMTRGLEAGADDFVGKSNDAAVLKARIRALLRRKFFQEENQRIIEELKSKELEAVRARAEKEAAEARAAIAEQLERANRELTEANQKLQETQAQLVHTEKMASLGQLVAGIAHEINNPLSFALNNVYTIGKGLNKLLGNLPGAASADAEKRMNKITQQLSDTRVGLERVRDLVLKLRSFSRLDAGVFGTLDVPESIETVLMFLHNKTKGRIEIKKRFDAPAGLQCYPGELNQVFMNLISNAVDAIGDKGKITISTSTDEKDGMYIVSVQDNGPGVSKENQGRIFDPFFTTKPVGEGMGLGLSISYGIIRSHKGSLEVVSEAGKGAKFIAKIPLNLSMEKAS